MHHHSEFEQREALSHVGYEVWMCAACPARRLFHANSNDGVVLNALLESQLIHARASIDFFLRSGGKRDITRDEFTSVDWQPSPKEAVDRLLDAKPLIDKYLAHLTWQRTDPDAQAWDYGEIAEDVVAVASAWTDFLANTNSELASTLRAHILWARNELAGIAN